MAVSICSAQFLNDFGVCVCVSISEWQSAAKAARIIASYRKLFICSIKSSARSSTAALNLKYKQLRYDSLSTKLKKRKEKHIRMAFGSLIRPMTHCKRSDDDDDDVDESMYCEDGPDLHSNFALPM